MINTFIVININFVVRDLPTYRLSIIYRNKRAGAHLICKCQAVASIGETFAGKRLEVVNQSFYSLGLSVRRREFTGGIGCKLGRKWF